MTEQTKAPLDFSQLDPKSAADNGIDVHLDDPRDGEPLYNGENKPVIITILGSDSAAVRAFDRAAQKRNMDRARRRGNVDVDVEALEANRVGRLVVATTGWQNLPTMDGQELPFSPENARRLYKDDRFAWIMEQLERAIGDRQRFFASSSGK